MKTYNSIGIENQIEDILFGESQSQLTSKAEKINFAIKNVGNIVKINDSKVFDVSIIDSNLWYNLRKNGVAENQKYYYPIQYAKIEFNN